jgi:hypothetical protein
MVSPLVGFVCPERFTPKLTPGGRSAYLFLPWESMEMPEDLGYSANIAIWATRRLAPGAEAIHLWGFDHAGGTYANGAPVEDPWRWERERRFFARTLALAEPGGVPIIRH